MLNATIISRPRLFIYLWRISSSKCPENLYYAKENVKCREYVAYGMTHVDVMYINVNKYTFSK